MRKQTLGVAKVAAPGIVAAAMVLVGCASTEGNGSSDDEAREFPYAYEGPESTVQGIAADIFEENLAEASDGNLTISQRPGGQLGGEPELLEQLRGQEIPFINSSTANAAQIAQESGVFSLHYIFEDTDHVQRALQDQEVIDAYRDMIEERVDNVRVLTLYSLPMRNMYAPDTEVHGIEDIQGQAIRVQATNIEDRTYNEYGAQTVHMPFPELYSSLQTGVVDMAENAVTYYALNNHHEVAPIMSMTEHAGNVQVIWVAEDTWESFSEQEQGWVQQAADAVNEQAIPKAWELEKDTRAEYEEMGVEFVDDVDKQSFMKVAEPLQDELASELGPHAETILELVREAG